MRRLRDRPLLHSEPETAKVPGLPSAPRIPHIMKKTGDREAFCPDLVIDLDRQRVIEEKAAKARAELMKAAQPKKTRKKKETRS